jgi:hypothetical protein
MGRDAEFPEPVVYSFICISEDSPVKEISHETEEKGTVTIHSAPHIRKACVHWGAAGFPKGIVCDAGVTTPVPCSLQHDTVHFGLGRPLVLHGCYYLPHDPGCGTHVMLGKDKGLDSWKVCAAVAIPGAVTGHPLNTVSSCEGVA